MSGPQCEELCAGMDMNFFLFLPMAWSCQCLENVFRNGSTVVGLGMAGGEGDGGGEGKKSWWRRAMEVFRGKGNGAVEGMAEELDMDEEVGQDMVVGKAWLEDRVT